MRRQITAGEPIAGSSRHVRLDPLSLPINFEAGDARADGHTRRVEIHHNRIVVQRTIRGIPMTLSLRTRDFTGIALRLVTDEGIERAMLTLEHRDPCLCVPLADASDAEVLTADWKDWALTLALPQLVALPDGSLHRPFARTGAAPRRRRHHVIARRRPSFLTRRKGPQVKTVAVFEGEREIIARR